MLKRTEVSTDPSPESIYGKDLKIGELGKATEVYAGHYLLRTFDGLVDLHDPLHTWPNSAAIKVLRVPNATVTLTFGSGS